MLIGEAREETGAAIAAAASPDSATAYISDMRCPACTASDLTWSSTVECNGCGMQFPLLGEIPVMINDATSVFSRAGIAGGAESFFRRKAGALRLLDSLTPKLALNVAAANNYERLSAALPAGAKVLVVGGAISGDGFSSLLRRNDIVIVETDVSVEERTQVVCDAHDLPFRDASFDAVVAQAVLEHVVDPARCVSEIRRVLKNDGLVYAEIPFMQPVHGGPFDFTRFSRAGLLLLFRGFEASDVGVACGPGSALAYSLVYAVQAAVSPGVARKVVGRVARFLAAPLKYLDLLLVRSESSLDGASSLFFFGRKSDVLADERTLVASYRGGFR